MLRWGHVCSISVVLTLLGTAANAQETGDACLPQARTPLERTYCKILAADPAAPLPSLQELRRNPEKTQRLLLRRPAQQAGIELPPATGEPPAAKAARPAPAAARSKPTGARAEAPPPAPPIFAGSGDLLHCQLQGASIQCANEDFRLQGNLPNSRLAPNALAANIPVTFGEYTGGPAETAQVMAYLSDTYRRYIEAMLGIGLGAATMSFTKFYYTFLEAQAKKNRFGERLTTMFEFLKKDKSSMGVQTHYNDELPQSLAQCMRLSDAVVVCDNVQQNWVYQKSKLDP